MQPTSKSAPVIVLSTAARRLASDDISAILNVLLCVFPAGDSSGGDGWDEWDSDDERAEAWGWDVEKHPPKTPSTRCDYSSHALCAPKASEAPALLRWGVGRCHFPRCKTNSRPSPQPAQRGGAHDEPAASPKMADGQGETFGTIPATARRGFRGKK